MRQWLRSNPGQSLADLVRMRPPGRDVVALGPQRARLAAITRLANCVVAAVGIALVAASITPAVALDPEPQGHWPSERRDLVVVDRTGDPRWEQATRHAARMWDQAQSGADVRLRWERAGSERECQPDGIRVPVCEAPAEELEGIYPFQGLADQDVDDDGHVTGATVRVCSDCGLSDVVRRVVATHEVGHALGLEHTDRLGSIMFRSGGTDQPDPGDYATLRRLYRHTD